MMHWPPPHPRCTSPIPPQPRRALAIRCGLARTAQRARRPATMERGERGAPKATEPEAEVSFLAAHRHAGPPGSHLEYCCQEASQKLRRAPSRRMSFWSPKQNPRFRHGITGSRSGSGCRNYSTPRGLFPLACPGSRRLPLAPFTSSRGPRPLFCAARAPLTLLPCRTRARHRSHAVTTREAVPSEVSP